MDDRAALRHGLRALCQPEAEVYVVDEVENGAQLLAQLPATPCEVLLDLHLSGLDGLRPPPSASP